LYQCANVPETEDAKILLDPFAMACIGGMPKKIKTGVIKNPPPIPSKPLKKPIKPLIDNKYKMFT
jgi:hypothetical protein